MKRKFYSLFLAFLALGAAHCAQAQTINTVAGGGSGGDGGPASTAALGTPVGVATDHLGNYYIADNGGNVVRKVNAAGIISTLAGNGTPGYLGDGGPATAAEISDIACIASDAAGNVYIADWGNNVVRKVTTAGIISTVAGNNTAGYTGDGAAATAAQLSGPFGLALDASGNLYIADQVNNVIRMVNSSGIISTFAGTGTSGFGGDGGPATAAKLAQPFGLAWYAGTLYIADANNSRIRQVASGNMYTFAGNGLAGYLGDGGAAISAEFTNPRGIAVDPSGNMYIADQGNSVIRKIAASLAISTVAGNNALGAGFAGDGGAATAAMLNNPINVAVDTSGNVYIADRDNSRVRELTGFTSILINGDTTVCMGANSTLTDATPGGVWSSSAPSIATVGSATGIVHGVAAGTATIAYHVGSDGATRLVIVSNCTRAGVGTTNGIADELNVYPNPSDGSFSINVSSVYDEQVVLMVTNITGAKVKTVDMTTNKETQLNLNVPDGMYIINAASAHSNYVQKIVVAK